MKCPKCNQEISDDAQFCTNCGMNLIKTQIKKADTNDYKLMFWLMLIFFIFIFVMAQSTSNDSEDSFDAFLGFIDIILLIVAIIYCKKIKNIVLKIARWILDFSTTLDALMGVIILITGIYICKDGCINYWWFVLGAFLYSLIALVKDYALYLLVDIRDSLKILADKEAKK